MSGSWCHGHLVSVSLFVRVMRKFGRVYQAGIVEASCSKRVSADYKMLSSSADDNISERISIRKTSATEFIRSSDETISSFFICFS